MLSAVRIIERVFLFETSSMFDVVGLRGRDSSAQAAIVLTADLKSLIFIASGAVK